MENNKIKESDNIILDSVKLSDVVGQPKAVQQLKEFIFTIENNEISELWRVKPSKGLLLVGPPGTGKTMSIKALVNEIKGDVILHELKFKDIESMWIGASVLMLKSYFKRFKEDAKSNYVIVFIDEIDAILPKRTEHLNNGSHQRLNVFLEWMDGGIHSLQNISLIGATNCLEKIDEAARRPGRFDRIIEFHPLSSNAIIEAFKVHLNLKQLAEHQVSNIEWGKIEESIKDAELAGAAIPNILDRILIEKAIEHHSNFNAKNTNRTKNKFSDKRLFPAPISTDDLLNKISNFLASLHA